MLMKSYGGYIGFLFFLFIFLSLAACDKPAKPTIYSGLKSVISEKAIEYNNRGLAFAQKEQYREAIEEYKNAIFEEPTFTAAYFNCGKAYYSVGNYDMAKYCNLKIREILNSKAAVIRESEEGEQE